jgi:hypothetical protein
MAENDRSERALRTGPGEHSRRDRNRRVGRLPPLSMGRIPMPFINLAPYSTVTSAPKFFPTPSPRKSARLAGTNWLQARIQPI